MKKLGKMLGCLASTYRKGKRESSDGSRSSNCEAGLTLMECLVAIAVVSASIGVIAPITVLSVATRVRNQRAEQALYIAQAEVERVRLIVERGGDYTAQLNEIVALSSYPTEAAVLPPDTAASSPSTATVSVARKVLGNEEFSVQLFRTTDANGINDAGLPVAFDLNVRVYRTTAIDTLEPADLSIDAAALTMTDDDSGSINRPLAVLKTYIVKSDEKKSLCDYYDYTSTAALTSTAAILPEACSL